MKVANLRLGLECNHDCLFCTIADDNDKTLSTKEAKEKIDHLIEQGVDTINFTGGEPTIRDDLVELIAYAKKKGAKHLELQTNGVALSDTRYLEDVLGAGINHNLLIAFHSHKKEIYNKITNSENFEKAKKGLLNTIERHKITAISHVINELNYKDLVGFSEFIFNTGKKPIIYFSLLRPNGNTKDNRYIIPNLKNIEPYLKQALDFLIPKGFDVEVEGIPLCFMSGYDDNSAETRRLKQVGAYEKTQVYANKDNIYDLHQKIHNTLKVKSGRCKSCNKDAICGGIWKEYALIKGVKELRPFTHKKTDRQKNTNKKSEKEEVREPHTDLGLGNRCNNSCIMCTSVMPLPEDHKEPNTDYVFKEIERYPRNQDSVLITGGEPTIRKDFFKILKKINSTLPQTRIKIVSNARMFSYKRFVDLLSRFRKIEVTTEFHGPDEKIHDHITQTKGSFKESFEGVKNIISKNIPLELRIVVSKLNYRHLPKIARLYSKEFPQAIRVVLFPIDIIGNAYKNKEKTLVSYTELKPYLQKAIDKLEFKDKRVFHTPFCILDKEYWKYIEGVTVLERRVDLVEVCAGCIYEKRCPKIWRTYAKIKGTDEFKPIKEKD